jgi:large subunit ribosomal protein L13
MKTYSAKASEITRQWYIVDASGMTLGRLATIVATRLIGKHKPTYTAHMDGGDYVVIINAAQIQVTGNKLADKKYYRHSGYPGGLTETTLQEVMDSKPERAIEMAVRGMIPKNRLLDPRMKRLKVYADANHPHDPQSPQPLGVTNG